MTLNTNSDELRKVTKKKRSTVKGKFHRLYNTFKSEVESNSDLDVLEQILKDLEVCYNDLENKHSDYIDILDSEDENDKIAITTVNDDIDKIYKELCNARSTVVSRRRKLDDERVKIEPEVKMRPKKSGDVLRIKKLDASVFNGSIRTYPTFKKDYELRLIASFGKDPFALTAVQGISNDFEKMVNRLNMKYGCPSKLVDDVLQDIRKLKRVPDNDITKFLSMISRYNMPILRQKKYPELVQLNILQEHHQYYV